MKNRLKVLRAERDWSQADLADQAGVSRQNSPGVWDKHRADLYPRIGLITDTKSNCASAGRSNTGVILSRLERFMAKRNQKVSRSVRIQQILFVLIALIMIISMVATMLV